MDIFDKNDLFTIIKNENIINKKGLDDNINVKKCDLCNDVGLIIISQQ